MATVILFNKPFNVLTQFRPDGDRPTLARYLTDPSLRVAGRLDLDSEGLLLLTDDGSFNHAMSSPKRHVPKLYLATTRDPVTPALVEHLLKGVQLSDEPAPLAALRCEPRGTHQLEIMIEQGKYHQVKRMLAAAGNHCAALQRIAIGGLTLESLALQEGEWRYLDMAALALLRADAA